MATNGLVVMTPSSIAYSGTSASINADGSVDFSAVSSLSLNGVFTSDYDNYMVVCSATNTNGNSLNVRLRVAGTDSTSSSYVRQEIEADGTSITANRATYGWFEGIVSGGAALTGADGVVFYLFGPFLTQPTAARTVNVRDNSGAYLVDKAYTHNQSTSYDGFSIVGTAVSGLVTVFGFNQ